MGKARIGFMRRLVARSEELSPEQQAELGRELARTLNRRIGIDTPLPLGVNPHLDHPTSDSR